MRLKVERMAHGWSRAELARRSRVNESNYGQIENRRRAPYVPEISRIADALSWGGDPADLLMEADADASN